uniref:Uncharacterized protein n=1 Tax=Rhizophora mucronata TaxID=61149 RepID=A0A2P2JMM9_RHIMU
MTKYCFRFNNSRTYSHPAQLGRKPVSQLSPSPKSSAENNCDYKILLQVQ